MGNEMAAKRLASVRRENVDCEDVESKGRSRRRRGCERGGRCSIVYGWKRGLDATRDGTDRDIGVIDCNVQLGQMV